MDYGFTNRNNRGGVDMNLERIKTIESSNDPKAYNAKSGARGLFQVTEVVLHDYNVSHDTRYGIEDLFDGAINEKIAAWYVYSEIPHILVHFGIPPVEPFVIAAYNWGVGNVKKWFETLPVETQNYLRKYYK